MSAYRIDLQTPLVRAVPCTFVPSTVVPGKILSVNEDGSALVVLPNGTERPAGEPKTSTNWDSPWTQAECIDDLLIYRSAEGPTPGTPRIYKRIGG